MVLNISKRDADDGEAQVKKFLTSPIKKRDNGWRIWREHKMTNISFFILNQQLGVGAHGCQLRGLADQLGSFLRPMPNSGASLAFNKVDGMTQILIPQS